MLPGEASVESCIHQQSSRGRKLERKKSSGTTWVNMQQNLKVSVSIAHDVPCVRLLTTRSKEYFCNENVFVTGPGQLFQALAHLNFALAVGVDLCRIKSVDAILPCGLQAVLDGIPLDGSTIGQPPSKRESACSFIRIYPLDIWKCGKWGGACLSTSMGNTYTETFKPVGPRCRKTYFHEISRNHRQAQRWITRLPPIGQKFGGMLEEMVTNLVRTISFGSYFDSTAILNAMI